MTTTPFDNAPNIESNGADNGPDDCGHDDEDCAPVTPCCGDLITSNGCRPFLSTQDESPTGMDSGQWPGWSLKEWTGCMSGEAVMFGPRSADLAAPRLSPPIV